MSEEERELLARISQVAGLCSTFNDESRFTDDLKARSIVTRTSNQARDSRRTHILLIIAVCCASNPEPEHH